MGSTLHIDNKRIAKNTLLLYIRMVITMLIGLFSVRIVLRVLGETDYGIYNVVGGVITMLAFLNNSLASTTQRFLSFELGKKAGKSKEFFKTSISLYILLSLILLVVGETLGLWFVNEKLVIPKERIFAANCIYQFSIVSFIFTVLSAPYNAAVIAHEKMSFFAYVSIIDACCKLGICFALLYSSLDKLILYGTLMMLMSLAVFLAYVIYCRYSRLECQFGWLLQREFVAKIMNFAGWSTFGALANIFRAQGINFMLNIFFGPVVNAARGIAYQAESALLTLIQNFYIAVRPQTIKSYADGSVNDSIKIVFFATKIGYIMMLVLFSVFVFEADYIFDLWLKDIPAYTIVYFKIIMIAMMMETLTIPMTMLIHANGNVMCYQLFSGIITASSLLIAYIFIQVLGDCISPMLSIPIVSFITLINVLYQVNRLISFPIGKYFKLLFKLVVITAFCCSLTYFLHQFLGESLCRVVITTMLTVFIALIGLLFVIDSTERKQVKILCLSVFSRIKIK